MFPTYAGSEGLSVGHFQKAAGTPMFQGVLLGKSSFNWEGLQLQKLKSSPHLGEGAVWSSLTLYVLLPTCVQVTGFYLVPALLSVHSDVEMGTLD